MIFSANTSKVTTRKVHANKVTTEGDSGRVTTQHSIIKENGHVTVIRTYGTRVREKTVTEEEFNFLKLKYSTLAEIFKYLWIRDFDKEMEFVA